MADPLREALEKIRKTPVIPFPDRDAHSERAFADAVWRAWSRIQQIADAALSAPPVQEQGNIKRGPEPSNPAFRTKEVMPTESDGATTPAASVTPPGVESGSGRPRATFPSHLPIEGLTEQSGSGHEYAAPCPFCGGTDIKSGRRDGTPYTDCKACHATVYFYGESFWNQRAPLSQPCPSPMTREEAEKMAEETLEGLVFDHWNRALLWKLVKSRIIQLILSIADAIAAEKTK